MLESGEFELGWTNIKRAEYVGYSHGYSKKQSSVGTTNGAGPRNTQMFVLSPDLVVLHALPGFWHPEDLARELQFAKVVGQLWADPSKPLATKRSMYKRLHRREVFQMSAETHARSDWQGFDRSTEFARMNGGELRDTVFRDVAGEPVIGKDALPKLKPLNVLVHERLSRRPFVAWHEFDIESFVDYGKLHYDNNRFEKTRKKFRGQAKLRKKREKQARRR